MDQKHEKQRREEAENMQAQMSKEDKANKQLPDSKCTKEAEKPSKKVSTTPAAKSPSPLPNSPMEKKGKTPKVVSMPAPPKTNKTKLAMKQDKEKKKREEKEDAYNLKDHDTAKSSKDAAFEGPACVPKKDNKEAQQKANKKVDKKDESTEKKDKKKATKENEKQDKAKKDGKKGLTMNKKKGLNSKGKTMKTMKKKKAGPAKKKKAKKAEDEGKVSKTKGNGSMKLSNEAKKKAHAMYMRFWRSVNESLALSMSCAWSP